MFQSYYLSTSDKTGNTQILKSSREDNKNVLHPTLHIHTLHIFTFKYAVSEKQIYPFPLVESTLAEIYLLYCHQECDRS